MWNDHWSIMKPVYFIIRFLLILILDFLQNDVPGPKSLNSTNMWSALAVLKQYNKMAVLLCFLVNSTLIYIFFSLNVNQGAYSVKSISFHPLPPSIQIAGLFPHPFLHIFNTTISCPDQILSYLDIKLSNIEVLHFLLVIVPRAGHVHSAWNLLFHDC